MSFEIKDIDHGWAALVRAIDVAKNGANHVKVGVMGDEMHEGEKATMVQVAAIQEFGAPEVPIPERSYVRSTFNENREKYLELLKRGVKALYKDKDPGTLNRALGLVGARMAADMKKKIRTGIDPPLKQGTIDKKGSSKPLVDTGQLLSSITWAVVRKDGSPVETSAGAEHGGHKGAHGKAHSSGHGAAKSHGKGHV